MTSKETEQKKEKDEKFINVRNTPFTGVRTENNEWILVCGRRIIAKDKFPSFGHLLTYIKYNQWELITILCTILIEENSKKPTKTKTTNIS